MARYLAGRLAGLAMILFLVCLFTYLIFFKLSPDPALMICGKTCTPERIEQIRTVLGLDEPFVAQFGGYLLGLFAGRDYGTGVNLVHCPAPCLGYSFQTSQSVWEMILDRLPVSATVAVGAAVLWLLIGLTAGLVSAVKEGSWWDRAAMGLALGGASVPNYVLALALQYVLVVQLEILPFPSAVPFSDDPVLWFQSYLMPWLVLATGYACLYARLTRSNVIDTLAENFMRTARAKGLSPALTLRRHALRPALTPIATIFGMDFAALLGGALITETVFGLNGVGKMAADSIAKNDQPVIMAVTLLAAFFVVVGNVVVDLLYTGLDPRVRVR
ncbi:ABC transporter permease [Nonomuraea muscovyensis]|uniref:Peptide/nickel transport system permease protein n=1 Tax=Nonomuraea muscovyensis TaxID=1124761 RepID=A0A7X0C5T7_9ACTN|nr:ABC transporter permease [Nonomuraea muscovyensis]MBB6347985.1 peptide/nickel transport system permease protein [Nonomuraea muscovyensis]MDF2710982.1 transporter permease subunit [Nonomuraea muscovyensis]